jgi:hypothetical protein
LQKLTESLGLKWGSEEKEIENESEHRELLLLQLQCFLRDSLDELNILAQVRLGLFSFCIYSNEPTTALEQET